MSGIPSFPQLPNPPLNPQAYIAQFLGQLPLPTGVGQSSPFSNQQQAALQALANGLGNTNPTLVTTFGQDLINAESQLTANNLTLNQMVTNLLGILQNPTQYISKVLGAEFIDTSFNGIPTQLYNALGAPNITVQGTPSGILAQQSNQSSGSSIGVARVGGVGLTSTLVNTGTGGQATIALPSQMRPFIDAMFGQNPFSIPTIGSTQVDAFAFLQGIYNFWLNTSGTLTNGISQFQTLLAGFGIGGLLSNSISPSGVTYRFPNVSGDTFANFIQALLSFTLSPATVTAEILLTPPSGATSATSLSSQLSVTGAMWSFLSGKSPTSGQLVAGQQYIEPLVNVLFGTNPSTSSSSDPFQFLFNIISAPQKLIAGLFGGTSFGLMPTSGGTTSFPTWWKSSGWTVPTTFQTITPQTLVADLFIGPNGSVSGLTGGPNGFIGDLFSIIAPQFMNGFFIPFFPLSVQTVFTDMISHPGNVPGDILGLLPANSLISGAPTGLNFFNMLTGLFSSFSGIPTSMFAGQGTQTTYNFLAAGGGGNSLSYKSGNSPPGWQSTSIVSQFNSLNGHLPGDLGYAIIAAAAALNEIAIAISDGSGSLGWGSVMSAPNDAQHVMNAIALGLKSIITLIGNVIQLASTLANPSNILSNSGIPTSPSGSWGSLTGLSSLPPQL